MSYPYQICEMIPIEPRSDEESCEFICETFPDYYKLIKNSMHHAIDWERLRTRSFPDLNSEPALDIYRGFENSEMQYVPVPNLLSCVESMDL